MEFIKIPYEFNNRYRSILFKKVRGYKKNFVSNRFGVDVMYSRCGKTYCFAIRYDDVDYVSFFCFDYDENDNLFYIPVDYDDARKFVDILSD